jgi:hypothetical protein
LTPEGLFLRIAFSGNLPIFLLKHFLNSIEENRIPMTTKAPAQVTPFPPESLEKIAYNAVATIPTQEPNDRHRLGYNVWMWLVDRKGTLTEAVRASGSRMHLPLEEVVKIVTQQLKEQGIEL